MNQIKITISGPPKSGKTTLAYFITQAITTKTDFQPILLDPEDLPSKRGHRLWAVAGELLRAILKEGGTRIVIGYDYTGLPYAHEDEETREKAELERLLDKWVKPHSAVVPFNLAGWLRSQVGWPAFTPVDKTEEKLK